MQLENLESSRAQLTKIAKEEIRKCLQFGKTDLETVAKRVEERASKLIAKLAPELARAEVREIIRRLLKRTRIKPEPEPSSPQMEFEFSNMEEFRGIPPNIAYEDAPGHVAYVSYLNSLEHQRTGALALLGDSIEADKRTYHALKSGNEFAEKLMRAYGDLPVRELYRKFRADQKLGGKN